MIVRAVRQWVPERKNSLPLVQNRPRRLRHRLHTWTSQATDDGVRHQVPPVSVDQRAGMLPAEVLAWFPNQSWMD